MVLVNKLVIQSNRLDIDEFYIPYLDSSLPNRLVSRENGIFITFLHKLHKHKSYNPRPNLEQYEGL
jgi:hypothetical protein